MSFFPTNTEIKPSSPRPGTPIKVVAGIAAIGLTAGFMTGQAPSVPAAFGALAVGRSGCRIGVLRTRVPRFIIRPSKGSLTVAFLAPAAVIDAPWDALPDDETAEPPRPHTTPQCAGGGLLRASSLRRSSMALLVTCGVPRSLSGLTARLSHGCVSAFRPLQRYVWHTPCCSPRMPVVGSGSSRARRRAASRPPQGCVPCLRPALRHVTGTKGSGPGQNVGS